MHDERPILLIEDNHDDAMTFRRLLSLSAKQCPLVHSQDKEGALLYLQERPVKPRLIVMNMDTPQMPGTQFLHTIKNDETLCCSPVVALASQRCEEIIQQSFHLGVAGYMIKAESVEDRTMQFAVIMDYWSLNRLPLLEFLQQAMQSESLPSLI